MLANSSLTEAIECEIPSGMMMYVEVLGAECSTLEEAPFYGGNEEELRTCAQKLVPQDLSASIDDVAVENLDKYIVLSPSIEFTVPENNILAVTGRGKRDIGWIRRLFDDLSAQCRQARHSSSGHLCGYGIHG